MILNWRLVNADSLGKIDLVLLSHADNFDHAERALLPKAASASSLPLPERSAWEAMLQVSTIGSSGRFPRLRVAYSRS